jgi:hypothetical protein
MAVMPVIPALGRWRLGELGFKASPGKKLDPHLNKPGAVVQSCGPSYWEVEIERSQSRLALGKKVKILSEKN